MKSGGCPQCKELRCRSHCRCQGSAHASGRKAPRANAKAASKAEARHTAVKLLLASVKPAPLQVQAFTDASWLTQALGEIKAAGKVVMASYTYDNPKIQEAVVKKLQSRADFSCEILVDRSAYETGLAPYEQRRLKQLKDLGAAVYLCSGTRGRGVFHWKCVVLDSQVAYAGSANLTLASSSNRDLMMRLTGPIVSEVMSGLDDARRHGKLL